jgi:hypothetical protein
MYAIDECSVCGERQRTIVSEYNRLIFLDNMWESDLARFDYALCHGCGLVYATRRPDREEYNYLYENFNEFLARRHNPKSLNVAVLTPEKREELDAAFLPWWELRTAPGERTALRKTLQRELENVLTYVPQIMRHMPLEGTKVLYIRAKGGALADFMKRLLGVAQVDLITLFPTHKYLAEKYAGIRAVSNLDYEDFKVPFDEKYDLIIENHILIHMLDPTKTFEVFASHLNPGGALFLHKELADNRLYEKGKNLFAELRPFHYQQFDLPTVERMLHRYGFSPVFLRYQNDAAGSEILGLAKFDREPGKCPRIGAAELRARRAMYARWRDESILSLPKARAEALFGDELESIWKRVRANGGLKPNKKGRLVALRSFPEAGDAELAISEALRRYGGSSSISVRERSKNWLAGMLKDTKAADWVSKKFVGTRVGRWVDLNVHGRRKARARKPRYLSSKRGWPGS